MRGTGLDIEEISDDLYANELNASVLWTWDGGFHATFRDPPQVEGWTFPAIGEVVAWLRDRTGEYYPDKWFARKFGGVVRALSPKLRSPKF